MNERIFGQRYKILEKIGSGGMANVYKGEDQVLNRFVAIKILHEQFSNDESFIARFKQEAQSAANLTHPNIVNIFDWGTEGNSYYIIMEYLKGQNLKDYITDAGHLTWQEACDIGAQVANALIFAHKKDVVHRDIKPHNIIITKDTDVKVTDFGIARAGASTMTQTGAILGTAHYISPEQSRGLSADYRSDIYSLGIVIYEMLAGQPPFVGDNPVGIAMKHIQEEIPQINTINPSIPNSVVAILNKALAKNPDERYQNASELKDDLNMAMKGMPVRASVLSEQNTVIINPPKPKVERRPVKVAPKKKKKKKLWPVFSIIAIFLLAAGAWALMSAGAVKRIEVPDIAGLSLDSAKSALKEEGLSLEIDSRQYSENVKKGLIVEQIPEAGFLIEEGEPVKVIISRGIEMTTVPSLYGKTRSEAESALTEQGLNLGEVTYEESDQEPDVVLKQSVRAGKEVTKDNTVDIVLSKEIEKISVINVIGNSRKNAVLRLAGKGLKASVVERFNEDIEAGLVYDQSPAAGNEVEKNTTITIYVSKGVEVKKVTVPSVVGLSLAEATNEIQNAGLKISSSGTGAMVAEQNPAAGTEVDEGSTVTVVLGS